MSRSYSSAELRQLVDEAEPQDAKSAKKRAKAAPSWTAPRVAADPDAITGAGRTAVAEVVAAYPIRGEGAGAALGSR